MARVPVDDLAADPEKTTLVARHLAALRNLDVPTIARGFFILPEETSLLNRQNHLQDLEDAGVQYFEVEFDSLFDPENYISNGLRERLRKLFERFDDLVTDVFDDLSSPLGLNDQGAYLELGDGRDRPKSFKPPRVARLIRTCTLRR